MLPGANLIENWKALTGNYKVGTAFFNSLRNATVTTLAEIREYGRNTGLLPGKLNAQDWQAALNLMKTHQMIELPGAILNVEDQTPIYIYGTVNIFCSSTAINELVQRYRDDAEEKTTEGEVASETGEEDLYPDVSE